MGEGVRGGEGEGGSTQGPPPWSRGEGGRLLREGCVCPLGRDLPERIVNCVVRWRAGPVGGAGGWGVETDTELSLSLSISLSLSLSLSLSPWV